MTTTQTPNLSGMMTRLDETLDERRPVAALTDGEQQADEELAADLDGITPSLPMVGGGR